MARRKGDVSEVFYSVRLREVSARMVRCWGLGWFWVDPLNLQKLEKVGKRCRNCTFSSPAHMPLPPCAFGVLCRTNLHSEVIS